jgi:hypothetical protein
MAMATNGRLTGPITGGTRGRPWSRPQEDLDARGYVMEEFFLDGTATSYRLQLGAEYTPDGRWHAERDDTAPFRTRFLVVRPADASRFNGTVVVQWLNVTAGYELGTADDDELLSGYAWVGASAQRVGIHGFPADFPRYSGRQAPNPALQVWDPDRYGSLSHPGDRYSFDIFSQVARAVGPDRDPTAGVDPMGGLDAERLIATGASQSGSRLTTYINAVQPLEKVFDAFMPTITSGFGASLADVRRVPGDRSRAGRLATRLRDDTAEPVIQVNTECEAEAIYPRRVPDSERYRFWEVAGAPHTVAIAPTAQERPDGKVDNPLTYRPVVSAAYRHLHRWLVDGTPAPSQPRIEFEGDPAEIKRDENGNTVGGIRLPEMEAPIATYRGRDDTGEGLSALYGWMRPFTPDELRARYGSRDTYVKSYVDAVDRLVATGALRPEDAPPMKDDAPVIARRLDL